MDWAKVGEVTHYFGKAGVAVLALDDDLEIGDWIAFVRDGELVFEQEVTSMQIEYHDIVAAEPGDNIGLLVAQKVRPGMEVYRRL
jgi:hypothetical protein